MKPNGQHKTNGRKKNGSTLTPEQLEIALRRDNAAYAAGFRECYGLLMIVVNELPMEARLKYVDKFKELDDKVRGAESRAGKGR